MEQSLHWKTNISQFIKINLKIDNLNNGTTQKAILQVLLCQ